MIIVEKIVQTAGRAALSEFAHFNDDVLFSENWNNQDINVKTRSIITVVALMASGITDSSLKFHLQNAVGEMSRKILDNIKLIVYTTHCVVKADF